MKNVFLSIVLILVFCLFSGCGKSKNEIPASNSIIVIVPYKYAGTWVFDDPDRNLKKEAFVAGIPMMIDKMTENIKDADKGFRLIFSASEFPDYTYKLTLKKSAPNGNWYYCEQLKTEGWLCPALFKFYKTPPNEIYVKGEPLK